MPKLGDTAGERIQMAVSQWGKRYSGEGNPITAEAIQDPRNQFTETVKLAVLTGMSWEAKRNGTVQVSVHEPVLENGKVSVCVIYTPNQAC